ncbi:MAG: hypothetical protein D4R93_04530 [Deltaproteobacteria bacterium]|nr:MAG: hypothetical protein D4R93_04530 [Deltaproteobacteria bacterium]
MGLTTITDFWLSPLAERIYKEHLKPLTDKQGGALPELEHMAGIFMKSILKLLQQYPSAFTLRDANLEICPPESHFQHNFMPPHAGEA